MAGPYASSQHLRTSVQCLMWFWTVALMLPATGLSQVISIPTGGGVPQAATRDELDEFGSIYDEVDANSRIRAADKFAQDFPKSQFLEYADMVAMHAYHELGDSGAARAMAQAILDLNPKNVDALLALAELVADGSSQSKDDAAQWNLASDYAQSGLSELNRYTLPPLAERQRWLRTKREFLARGYTILGRVALAQGKLDEAIKKCAKAASFSPLGDAFYHLGLAYEAKGQYEQAAASLSRAQTLGPGQVSRLAMQELGRMKKKGAMAPQ